MKKVSFVLLIATGLTNFVPIIGVISAEQITSLYSVSIDSEDLGTLMRHRAVMLGLIGGFIIYAAFRPKLRIPAATIGLVSMMSFVILAIGQNESGADVMKVAYVDVAGSIAAIIILVIAVRAKSAIN